ncbi:hypothetical protein DUI87_20923 [Hirundo rustica rustica]|uniref:Uncharacterized protein n=1 Tax=Hirundo rustica rustica TaxID=333673 RepID=A0A3M0JNU4_HIRRU|nr:hypothetical protein DUI87_20923 [Hirundo rustica rustica]
MNLQLLPQSREEQGQWWLGEPLDSTAEDREERREILVLFERRGEDEKEGERFIGEEGAIVRSRAPDSSGENFEILTLLFAREETYEKRTSLPEKSLLKREKPPLLSEERRRREGEKRRRREGEDKRRRVYLSSPLPKGERRRRKRTEKEKKEENEKKRSSPEKKRRED